MYYRPYRQNHFNHYDHYDYYYRPRYRPYDDLLLYELMRDRDYYRNKYLNEIYKVDPCKYSDLLCQYKR